MKLMPFALSAILLFSLPSFAADSTHLGNVRFPVSCAAGVQPEFSTGVALLHSFQYSQATQAFQKIARQDPKCAMAYWGLAMSLYTQLWSFPNAAALKKGHTYMETAQRLDAKTPREGEYISAAADFFQENPSLSPIARTKAYSNAMGTLSGDHPTDVNAGAFYALSLVALAQEGVNDMVNRKHAIAILQKLFAAHSDNPGVDHYLIHAADTPELAPEALAAARNYAKIAPDSAHALHMPSHIFTRLGYWQESIASNLASAAAAERATRSGTDKEASYELHAMDYLEYAYLQSGEDKQAWGVVERTMNVPGDTPKELTEEQALYRITFAMETHDWKAAADMRLPPKDAYPSDQQDLYWARAIGAARLGNAAEARKNLAALKKVFASLPKNRWKQEYLRVADLYEAEAWTDYASGQSSAATAAMQEAVASDKSSGGGETGVPASEMLGDLLVELHKPALAAYQAALKTNPNRFDALYGAAQAAAAEGNQRQAKLYYQQLLKICGPDADRKELQQARQYLAQSS